MGGAYMAGFAMRPFACAGRIHHKQHDVCATPGGTNVTLLNSFWLGAPLALLRRRVAGLWRGVTAKPPLYG